MLKTIATWIVVLAILSGIGVAIFIPLQAYIKEKNRIRFRTQAVTQGEIAQVVNATGTVEPVLRVQVGASVSGPIEELLVDFNDKVSKDQLMARIDPRLYASSVQRDKAILNTRQAEVERAEAMLQQSINEQERGEQLRSRGSNIISQTEIDQLKFTRMAREADLIIAESAVDTAKANLENSEANLGYTEIRSPVDGVVIDRKVDSGQTVAAQFQTPEMFIVAPELDQRVHIYASVDEADIGLIRQAKDQNQPVRFTVDAYPDELFSSGKIVQIRLSSTEEQNVVTYPVVVETPNVDLKLLPGMTANLSFQIERRSDIIKIPNAALRFYPERDWVHVDDRNILDGIAESTETTPTLPSADEKADANRRRMRRHVWVQEGSYLRARPVTIGISDSRFSEMLEGNLTVDQALVVGQEIK